MKKILSVDGNLLNSKVIEQDLCEYFSKKGEEIEFYASQNPQETLDIINEHSIDIMFIDISSIHYNGIILLKHVKKQAARQPKIVAVTKLRDNEYRYEALKMNVYRYIYKPYDNKEIFEVLSKFFSKNYYNKTINRTEHFINIDHIENSDKEENTNDLKELEGKDIMNAEDFLALYSDIEIEMADIEDLDVTLERIYENIMDSYSLDIIYDDVLEVFEEYNRFLNQFSEFEELSKLIYAIIKLLNEIDIYNISSESMVCKNIIMIIQDLSDWKEKVFIYQSSENIYFINDAVLNSFVQLQDLLN